MLRELGSKIQTDLDTKCRHLGVLLICPGNEDIPKHRPPFKEKLPGASIAEICKKMRIKIFTTTRILK